jgi:YrhK-like protein
LRTLSIHLSYDPMSNRVYVLSSLCFLCGAILAFRSAASMIDGLYVAGSAFFLIAASLGVLKK